MSSIAHFVEQFAYDLWANRRTLASIEAATNPPAKSLNLYSHILAAQEIWHARVANSDSREFAVWPERDVVSCRTVTDVCAERWQNFLREINEADLQKSCSYQDTAGVSFDTAVHQILSHVVLHGAHHRGQIALLLREHGETPAVTDFIAYTRI